MRAVPTLSICVTCRGWPPARDRVPPGRRLAQRVLALTMAADGAAPDPVPIACMNLCRHGCNAALTGADGVTVIAGGLGPGDAAVLAWAQGGAIPGRLVAVTAPGWQPDPDGTG